MFFLSTKQPFYPSIGTSVPKLLLILSELNAEGGGLLAKTSLVDAWVWKRFDSLSVLCGGGTFSPFSVGLSSQSILNLVTLGEVANILLSNCKTKQMILRYYHIIKQIDYNQYKTWPRWCVDHWWYSHPLSSKWKFGFTGSNQILEFIFI